MRGAEMPETENEYGCVRCQAYHGESDGPVYAEHLTWQSKHGLRRRSVQPQAYPCPVCSGPTQYQMFSGGREWYCPACDTNGEYPAEGENLPRATLLRNGDAGATALRAQMDQELARLRDGGSDE